MQDVKKGLGELRDGLRRIKSELDEHYAEVDLNDAFISQMWGFVAKASSRLEDLQDDVNMADTTFNQAVSYYGEDDKGMGTSEFYGIFKTFVTSYKVLSLICISLMVHSLLQQKCQADNKTVQEEREAVEKRRKAAEEAKANRQAKEVDSEKPDGDTSVLDNLLEKLRNGDSVGRKSRRNRANRKPSASLQIDAVVAGSSTLASELIPAGEDKTVDLARDMLARLKSDGFETFSPTSPTRPARSSMRRTRRRRMTDIDAEEPTASPTFSDDKDEPDEHNEAGLAPPLSEERDLENDS